MLVNIHGEKSHDIIESALKVLENMRHRGAEGADNKTGDGAGILLQIPHEFILLQGIPVPEKGKYGTGLIFLPKDEEQQASILSILIEEIEKEGLTLMHLRKVPVHTEILGKDAQATEPDIKQIFIIGCNDQQELELKLYLIRKRVEKRVSATDLPAKDDFYIASLSTKNIVYKGMLESMQLRHYFPDLTQPYFTSGLALVHSRFSTNTFPTWSLAQPFRLLAHNGEINTIRGNRGWMEARESVLSSPRIPDINDIRPIIQPGMSDSASLDNVLEFFVASGMSLPHAMAMLVPESFNEKNPISEDLKAFYEYHSILMEPWDGPAALLFSDGRYAGGMLDRNGLRPARYLITKHDMMVVASEVGVMDFEPNEIKEKGRLQPGKILLIDTEKGEIYYDSELKEQLANAQPYRTWLEKNRVELDELKSGRKIPHKVEGYDKLLRTFGYSREDIERIIVPMCTGGAEPVGSMGNDTPLAILSARPQILYNYFRQQFAQVTNPPIDPIREELVTSLMSFIGPKPNLLDVNNVNPPRRIEIFQPVLVENDMAKLRTIDEHTAGKFRSFEIDITYPAAWGDSGVEAHLASLCAQAVDAIGEGYNILILSDENVSRERVAVPVLLALSALHQHLIWEGLRTNTGLIVHSGAVFETHDFALLLGYGAEAVHPYLSLALIRKAAPLAGLSPEDAVSHYVKAVGKGLTKVMAKMGICTVMSYRGARIFEAVGLNSEFVDRYFHGTPSKIEGLGLFDVMREAVKRHDAAYAKRMPLKAQLDSGGQYAWRADGEEHMWTPEAIVKLQRAARQKNYQTYKEYASIINDQSRRQMTLRGLLRFKTENCTPVPIDEVEPAKDIVKRFATGAMSMGSISAEAHATLAVAMNRIGGKSNTGEGGEDPKRYEAELKAGHSVVKKGMTVADVLGHDRIVADIELEDGDSLRSRIKQVASGRFGVTEQYLASADQIQIKMAQGAKPGEGGQLPGHKVTEYIAELRYSVPGVGLISPPPHHDIYSIEDLAQLIHDLKCANGKADISVKLVSETGVGTVAAGVAKAKADHIVIAGHDGGTGASPVSSVKHAGSCWEVGLAETQQTLVVNKLRERVVLQVDGQIKTGRDVVIGAMLGADEFGFATAPLVVEGCLMMRQCHLNTCPVGIATQDPQLRKRFKGQPSHVVNYFFFVAQEVREVMAQLGVRRFEELIGRSDLLEQRDDIDNWKAQGVDLARVLYRPQSRPEERRHRLAQKHDLEKSLDAQILAEIDRHIRQGQAVRKTYAIRNINRTVGTQIAHAIVDLYGAQGLADDTVHLTFKGTAGQSFGAFAVPGMTMVLEGDANDYVGKGLSGGRIIVKAGDDFHGKAQENIIAGNTTLYGATSGEAYFNGVAGERFAVRLSGASAVVEGTGDHGCEYMTGGTVVVLGKTGRNFASGMSGGVAYVFDAEGDFESHCNTSMVALERVVAKSEQKRSGDSRTWHLGKTDEELLKELIERHARFTGSKLAAELLEHWSNARARFVKVMPLQYKEALLAGAGRQ